MLYLQPQFDYENNMSNHRILNHNSLNTIRVYNNKNLTQIITFRDSFSDLFFHHISFFWEFEHMKTLMFIPHTLTHEWHYIYVLHGSLTLIPVT